ncbi:unnamed protein product [Musa acuminata subsp. burmannicoides]
MRYEIVASFSVADLAILARSAKRIGLSEGGAWEAKGDYKLATEEFSSDGIMLSHFLQLYFLVNYIRCSCRMNVTSVNSVKYYRFVDEHWREVIWNLRSDEGISALMNSYLQREVISFPFMNKHN